MRVWGTRRSTTPAPAFIERVGQSKDLLSMLPEADVVAIAVPLTAETENLFNAEAFAAMKPGAYLINIARGKVVNTDAMMAALKSGKLAGACLDVTDPEPLPAGHSLWNFPNVIITPHVAAQSEVTERRSAILLRENLRTSVHDRLRSLGEWQTDLQALQYAVTRARAKKVAESPPSTPP